MSKRKRKRRRSQSTGQGSRQPSADLQKALRRGDALIAEGRAQEAIGLLEPLLESYPRVADLHEALAYARITAGDAWRALDEYERAMELSRDRGSWLPLAALYLQLELHAYALRAFRQVLREQVDVPTIDRVHETVASLEGHIAALAQHLDVPTSQAERGLAFLEDGLRALNRGDYRACIAANRRAVRLLRDWPPPRNNLSLALFFAGQPEKAIVTAQQVLSRAPENVQALGNAIRFLVWTGREAEARQLWPRLKGILPQDASGRLKIAEAAAVLGDDESVYQVLRPLDRPDATQELSPGAVQNVQWFLAVAEANTGRPRAKRRLRALQKDTPQIGEPLEALEAGRPGPGWAERFPYFHVSDLMPLSSMEEFVELVGREDEMLPDRFRSRVARFIARFPQIVRVAEKMIWEEQLVEAGVGILEAVATPAARAVLRRFGLSQAGADDGRMQALTALVEAGEITEDTVLRVWYGGEWRELQIRQVEVSDQPATQYSPEAARLLDEGLEAFQQGDQGKAERLFRRVLELEPQARQAYNNLGTILAHRGEHAQAREMFEAALELDPAYVFPRCNLAIYLLDDGDFEGARAMLEPLKDTTHFHPQEMAFFSYTQARVLIGEQEYDAARRSLRLALEVYPGYEPAENLLEHLNTTIWIQKKYDSWMERDRKRRQATRARLQAKLTTTEPSLSEALSIYTKDALTGMARAVVLGGGWSALRKAELRERIVAELSAPLNLERIVATLTAEECAALDMVLERGGYLPWQDFDADYGNDLEESPYWQWHVPETVMGRLRLRGLLVEATVDGELFVVVPVDLRPVLTEALV